MKQIMYRSYIEYRKYNDDSHEAAVISTVW